MVRLLLSAALLLSLSLAASGCTSDDDEDCPSGQTLCNGVCRDAAYFQTAADDCGACGVACGIGTCAGGVCQCEGATPCPGQNPRCADTQSDPDNCGACGTACTRPGEGCALGACACVAPADDDCVTFCTDTLTDARNCGLDATAGCGTACQLTNEVCTAGGCACPASLPTVCGSACVNTLTDPRNCGLDAAGCGNVCPLANDVCVAGLCDCPDSLPDACPTRCVSLADDEQNCGSCGNECAPGLTCAGGRCGCAAGETLCSGSCVNLSTDAANCGACGNVCPATTACTNGSCSCPGGGPLTQHSNGVGQLFSDCLPLGTYDALQAEKAARAWQAVGTAVTGVELLCQSCLGWRTATACGVWCYGTGPADPLRGRVSLNTIDQVCVCPTGGLVPVWN